MGRTLSIGASEGHDSNNGRMCVEPWLGADHEYGTVTTLFMSDRLAELGQVELASLYHPPRILMAWSSESRRSSSNVLS